MSILNKSKVIAAKIEAVFNVAETLTNTETLEIMSSSSIDATLDTVERDVIKNSLLSMPPIPIRENASGTVAFELIPASGVGDALLGDTFLYAGMGKKSASGLGSGAFIGYSNAGTTPADAIYIAKVAETGTATAYLLGGVTDPTKSLTIKEFIGTNKSLQTTGNVVESLTFNFPTAGVCSVETSISGCGFTTNEADTKLVPTCISTIPYLGKSATFKFDGNSVSATDISISVENTVYSEESITANGYSSKQITGKSVSGSFTLLFEDYSMLTKLKNNTDGSLYLCLTQGVSKFAVYIPTLKLTEFGKSENEGIMTQTVSFNVVATCGSVAEPIIIANLTA